MSTRGSALLMIAFLDASALIDLVNAEAPRA